MSKDFYSPDEVNARYSPEQVIWVLKHIFSIRAGDWPPEYRETGYEKGGKKPEPKPNAYYVKPCEIAAEIEQRLEHCMIDGLCCWLTYAFDVADIAEFYHILAGFIKTTPRDIDNRVKMALKYCCSPEGSKGTRRTETYITFCLMEREGRYREAPDSGGI